MQKKQGDLLMFFKKSGQPDPKRPKLAVDSGGHGECSSSVSGIVEDRGDNSETAKDDSEAGAPVRGELEREGLVVTDGGEAACGEIWTKEQFKEKQKTYPWLTMGKTGLGCATCKKVGSLGPDKSAGMRLAKEWVSGTVKSSAPDIVKQQRALRKKICEHGSTKAHEMASDIVEKAKEDTLTNIIINNESDHIQTTARIFRTAYKEAKRHRPAYGFEQEIDCQEMNGLNMGRILHSNVACSHIQQHIATDMKKKLLEKIVTCAPKIGLMLDEATGLNRKSALIVYLRVQLPEMESPENIFFELIELDDLRAEGIVRKLLESLHRANFNEDFLSKTLVALTCDGASVMLGRKSGVAVRLQSLFPSLVVWHCAAHRLELAVGDVVKEMAAVNHFKMFMDKLYSLYSTSNKNRIELKECADALDVQLCKIGRVLDTRWVSSSLRAVEAVWKSCPALHRHFTQAAQDPSRDSTTRESYNRLAKRLSSHAFVTNLGLMYDALQELSELSLELQKQECNIMMSHKAISRQIRVFEAMSTRPGRHSQQSQSGVEEDSFFGVPLHAGRVTDRTLDSRAFFGSLARNLDKCLLSHGKDQSGYNKLIDDVKVVYPQYWPQEEDELFGEKEVEALCQQFSIHDPRQVIRAFREFRESYGELKGLLAAINTVPISSAECERGFSQMNLICSANRASLLPSTISTLLFLCLVGPPLTRFNPIPYVKSFVNPRTQKCTGPEE
ncbi:E3 SUMO-protein ligase KIAA1586 [Merluccius polli]|uniref:E3 SUMO-protein ligase KIAA1586 n=1 Tax=Merluccius polli TaxID=89951 RepID=A0AA47M5U1_MERPO|nr:E3 SUMO-protein ligase KIAA1586 [Merluccius polli]